MGSRTTFGGGSATPTGPGENWAIPVSAPASAPAAGVPFPRPGSALPGGMCGFDWSQIQYQEFSSEDPLVGLSGADGSWPVVLSTPPRPGYFWVVLASSWNYSGGAIIPFGMFLVPPFGAGPDKIQFRTKDGITGKFRSTPKFGIYLRGGLGTPSGNSGASSTFQHWSEFSPAIVLVPPGWALMVCGDKASNGPGLATTVFMQLAYAELPIGSDSPGFGV